MDKNLIIRADANSQIGVGHVMRCLALAQAWRDNGGQVAFVMCDGRSVFASRLAQEHFDLYEIDVEPGSQKDAVETVRLALQNNAQWIVLDGYNFKSDFQLVVKNAGLKLLCMDDYGHADHYYADIVLNQNLYAEDSKYSSRESNTIILLGTRYALLRKEFIDNKKPKEKTTSESCNILVTMGGGDPGNASLKVIQALQNVKIPNLKVKIIAGPSNPYIDQLRQAVQMAGGDFQLLHAVDNMAVQIAWSDIAITAGGSTCWELCCMSVPAIVLVISDDQVPTAAALHEKGCMINLGWATELSNHVIAQTVIDLINNKQRQKDLALKASTFVDGSGAQRVVGLMQ